ncbi:unnamed protein product [Mytilus edulis]|uniref:Uncharacterized protein n=1 Tax=Mytilus edulis TaxID=6550 RepID=A0A8S3RSL6_MYTED|nr:unnamed protein product [Mytilus edulis]
METEKAIKREPPKKYVSPENSSVYNDAVSNYESRQPDDQPERQNESFNRMTQNVPSNLRDNKNVTIVDTKNTYKEQEHEYNSSTPLDSKLDKSNTNVPGINRLHNVSGNDTEVDIEKLENTDKMKNDREDNVKGNSNIIDIKTKKTLKEHQHEPLVAVSDLMSDVRSKRFTSKQSSNHYALCGLWDFAGQKEFYATHQAFLTNSAVYLVVADMADDILKQDVKQNFATFQTVGGKKISL